MRRRHWAESWWTVLAMALITLALAIYRADFLPPL